jgi:hypothetical protein
MSEREGRSIDLGPERMSSELVESSTIRFRSGKVSVNVPRDWIVFHVPWTPFYGREPPRLHSVMPFARERYKVLHWSDDTRTRREVRMGTCARNAIARHWYAIDGADGTEAWRLWEAAEGRDR